jgi:hypothetical protein
LLICADDGKSTKTDPIYRLPESVKPLHYTLTIDTDLIEHRFSGHVRILVNVRSAMFYFNF